MAKRLIRIDYATKTSELEALLVHECGPRVFATEGEFPSEGITVNVAQVGTLSCPITEEESKALIASAALAPYGKGEQTIVDVGVRKTWQISAEAVQIGGAAWEHCLQKILKQIGERLGSKDSWTAQLYKLLIYDQGGFFAPHRDSEKASGMMGTLVVSLPSAHTGGELLVRHDGREVCLSLSKESVEQVQWAAFFANCEHEVKPVRSGYRVCLVFNLIVSPTRQGGLPSATSSQKSILQTEKLLEKIFSAKAAPVKLAYLLKHQYTPAELKFSTLKGEDRCVSELLLEVAQRANLDVAVGLIHIREVGTAKASRELCWQHRLQKPGGEEPPSPRFAFEFEIKRVDPEAYSVSRVEDRECYLDHLSYAQEGVCLPHLNLAPKEIFPAGALDGEPLDIEWLGGFTGNEGTSFERAYHRTALVLWPRERRVKVLLQTNPALVVQDLQQQVTSTRDPQEIRRIETELEICLDELEEEEHAYRAWYADQRGPDRSMRNWPEEVLLECALRLGRADLVQRVLEVSSTRRYLTIKWLSSLLSPTDRAPLYQLLGRLHQEVVHVLLKFFVPALLEQPPALAVALAERLSHAAGGDHSVQQLLKEWIVSILQKLQQQHDLTPDTVVALWVTLGRIDQMDLVQELLPAKVVDAQMVDLERVLMPAFEQLTQLGNLKDGVWLKVWAFVAESALEVALQSSQRPREWAQPLPAHWMCPLCKRPAKLCKICDQLKAFIANPESQEIQFTLYDQALENALKNIKRHRLSVVYSIIGTPQPVILHIKKTMDWVQASELAYQQAMRTLAALLKMLSPQQMQDVSALVARIRQMLGKAAAG